MILVVDGVNLSSAAIADRVGWDHVVLATSVAEARERLEVTEPTAMVVGGPPTGDAAAMVEDVRAGRLGPPWLGILAVTGGEAGDAVDSTVPPSADGSALAAAIEGTELLGRYRRAIQSFFDVCRGEPGSGDRERALREARREADAWLEAIHERADELPMDRLLQDD